MTAIKNFAHRQVPAVSEDYVPKSSPARTASRTGLNHDAMHALVCRTRKCLGTLSALQLGRPAVTIETQ